MIRPRWRPVLAALAAGALACGEDPAGPTAAELGLAGEYALAQFAGGELPVVVADPNDACVRLTMISGSLTLEEPDGFTLVQRYHHTEGCGQPADTTDRAFAGTFTLDSATTALNITLRPEADADWWTMTGTVDSARITLQPEIRSDDRDAGLLGEYTFEKQEDDASGEG